MAGERRSSYQSQLNSIEKRTSKEVTLPRPIPPDYDIMEMARSAFGGGLIGTMNVSKSNSKGRRNVHDLNR